MNKAYSEIVFVNGTSPDLDATNMNAISSGLNTVDNRVIALDTQVSANTSEITSLSNSTSAIASSLSTFSAATTSEIATINSNVSSLSASVSSATSEIATHTSEITSLSTATSELSSEVTYIGSEVAVNTSDIADLKNKPSSALVLTSSSPLATSSASNILGIECEGKSTQSGTPTPTNPIAIVDASGVVVAHTINLCEKIVSGLWDGTSISASSTRASSNKLIDVEGGKAYTVSFSSDKNAQAIIRQMDANNTQISQTSWITSGTSLTLESNTSKVALIFRISDNSANPENSISKVMLEQGTTASDYVAYQSNSIYINNCEAQASWVIGSAWDNGSVVGSGIWGRTEKLTIVNNSIHVVCDASMYRLRCSFWNGETYLSQITESDKSEATFTVPTNATHYALSIVKASGTSMTTEYTNMVHIKVVGIINDCLRSIGTVADTLVVKADGSGVLTRRVGTVDLGTLTWEEKTSSSTRYYTSNGIKSVVKLPSSNQDIANIKCEILVERKASGMSAIGTGTNYIAVATDGVVYASSESAPTSGKLYYELATPTTTTLTSTQVASILALKTYNGTTIVDSEIVKDVTYSADVKTYVDDRCNYVSSTEMVVGEFDGKTLYRKVIEFESSYSAGLAVIITDETITIKRFDGCVKYKNRIYPIGCKSNKFDVYIDNNALHFDCDYMDEGYGTITAIVEYTKDDVATLSEEE